MTTNDLRYQLLEGWLKTIPELKHSTLTVASADASFRRYFRATIDNKSYIVMDAPPDKEAIQPFISVTQILESENVRVPHIHYINNDEGFLILDDLGDQQYLDHLNKNSAEDLYNKALESLEKIQRAATNSIPAYDKKLLNFEMSLFPSWYIAKHLGIRLSEDQKKTLQQVFNILIKNALEQPSVFVHRDYHSRNLMLVDSHLPGVIDYQDAVSGPITYDLVSLLRDCYIAWPHQQVDQWALSFKRQIENRTDTQITDQKFLRWFDLMGIQRHLKAIGIFSRLNYRDGKQGYLKDIPRTLNYVMEISAKYPDTQPLATLIKELGIVKKMEDTQ